MPIIGLSEKRRIVATLHIRLGVTKTRNSNGRDVTFPTETDSFVITAEDGATKEILEQWGPRPKLLRIMLEEEYDALGDDGMEIVMPQANVAFGRSRGLQCRGSGGDRLNVGTAKARDKAWAERICQIAGGRPEQLPDEWYRIPCRGVDCPKYRRVGDEGKTLLPGHDEGASCHRTTILRAYLLHSTTDPASPDYCRILGVAQIASGSWNTLVDLNSGFEEVRRFTKSLRDPQGRSRNVPITIIRRPKIYQTGRRVIHYPLAVLPTPSEWQRFAMVPEMHVYISAPAREEYMRLVRSAVELDTLRDLIPGGNRPLIGAPLDEAAAQVHDNDGAPDVPTTEPQDATDDEGVAAARIANGWSLTVDEYRQRAADLTEPELHKRLTKGEREAVKAHLAEILAIDLRDPEVTFALQRLVVAAHEELGTAVPGGLTLSSMTVEHELWIRAHLPSLRASEPDDITKQDEAGDEERDVVNPGPSSSPVLESGPPPEAASLDLFSTEEG